jgi:hypothetical protein
VFGGAGVMIGFIRLFIYLFIALKDFCWEKQKRSRALAQADPKQETQQ